jgi:hypothetical protein
MGYKEDWGNANTSGGRADLYYYDPESGFHYKYGPDGSLQQLTCPDGASEY